ncbi:fungal-specific transcription factor domain-containing protein [Annulohypoxylon truncatum]|uniref:fungal-specific transcription factor domain-containing protein n=1 Tax=Annulohypoxylon truncatum TaxID=327061 RepID=UPI002008A648|nr:fungal-specific transcription factor domain-containing protein [Annulohypoxylon truncatum]KAI1205665.1 fungal-specific transcription factor domain-containing protein [Annulohypoxylon truncatum]
MPPGRPPKRPGEAADLDSPDGTAKCKLPRLDRDRAAPNDFSSVVKSKLQSYTRTGQACDRCKVRKIRCDALPEGCSHCINQNLECYVTDRVTGRTERRGYMQELEREKRDMLNHIRDLEKILQQNGVEVKPFRSSSTPVDSSASDGGLANMTSQIPDSIGKPQWSQSQSQSQHGHGSATWAKDRYRPPSIHFSSTLRSAVEPRPADTHIGVGADQAPLSSIKGTTLSILGSTIDIGSFEAPDMDEPSPDAPAHSPIYNKSVHAMLRSVANINPPLHVDYPPKADAFTYAEWYFLMVYPFHPVLHKPTFINLLARLYDDPNFKPTVAETTMIHLVFASIYLQYGFRNRENPEQRARLNDLSNKHYHYALSKWFDLSTSKTLYDIQALTMLCVHTMRFPKSNTSNMLSNYTLGLAIEIGLHRAWKKPGEETNLENELRKRTWWALLSTVVTLNGRMGRPMSIRLEDIDCEFPENIADELLSEDGVDTTRSLPCRYEIGVSAFKISALFLEMFANVYSTKRDPSRYVHVIEALEEQLEIWKENLPPGLRPNSAGQIEHDSMFALYAEYMSLEFRLTLRHPAACITNDPKLIAENTKICEETAKKMLSILHNIYRLKSLDTTWYCLAVYCTAIFSTLVAHWERRHDISAVELQTLRADMSLWLTILAETGSLMGCGMGLHDAVSSIIDRTISWIEHAQLQKANEPMSHPQLSQDMLKQSPHSPPYTNLPPPSNPTHPNPSHNDTETVNGSASHVIATSRSNYYGEATPESGTYPSLSYTDSAPHATNAISYDPNNSFLYAQAAGQVAVAQAQAHAHAQAQAQAQAQVQTADHNPLTTFATQATQMTQPAHMMWRQQQSSGGNTWQDWTAAIVDNQDRYSANALMSLGSSDPRPGANVDGTTVGLGVSMNGAPATTTATMQWPLLLFSDGVSGA